MTDKHLAAFLKLAERGCQRHGAEYWSGFLHLSFCALRQDQIKPDPAIEASYMTEVERWLKRDARSVVAEQFPEMLAHLSQSLQDRPTDFLGAAAGRLEVLNKYIGQFFTPFELSRTMARLNLSKTDAKRMIDDKGFISVQEPACGAGGMIIGMLDALMEYGYGPDEMYFEAWDISDKAAQMCFIQLSLLRCIGEVVLGDTLRMDIRERYPTPRLKLLRTLRLAPRPTVHRRRGRDGKTLSMT